jgi:hypothetical protein
MVCSHTKVKVHFKDCIFDMAIFYCFILHFSHILKKLNIKFEAKYNIQCDMNSSFFSQALHYSQIYNFTLNHDYKFKTIIVLKDIQVSESKKYMYFNFLNTWIPSCGIY